LEPLTGLLLAGLAAAGLAFLSTLLRLVRIVSLTDWGSPWINFLDGVNRLFCLWFHRMSPARLPLPAHGPAIVVANHVSGLDPLLLIAASPRPLRFIIAREQFERFALRWLFRRVGCIPVDRERQPEKALRHALKSLQQGEVVALFPFGRIHLPSDVTARIKPGAALLARRSGAPVVAAKIRGVRGVGKVVRAVFVRSRVSLRIWPPLRPENLGTKEIAKRIGSLLSDEPESGQPIGGAAG
jgi:1-acyl-sn-glycerol-3-phosphate acyltransferase